ncbi:hypothetical protein QR680_015676 [Steinernema hermaphroditum]|uniref:Uncharacterized protein n=1 Tax=Steinernema hermaphroditum TaxID=289476 RepID=A0AA39LL10_9BILA|nr:hypothetical protein QR680_015676 [Steinernema hermaphroditum]
MSPSRSHHFQLIIFTALYALLAFSQTTPGHGNCITAPDVIAVDTQNMTIFFRDSKTFLQTHPGKQAQDWNPYLIAIQNQILLNGNLNTTTKIHRTAAVISSYVGDDLFRAFYLYAIRLDNWGDYHDLQRCGGF